MLLPSIRVLTPSARELVSGVLLFLPKLMLLYRVPVLPSIQVLLARTLVLLYKALVVPPSSYREEAGRRQALKL